MLKSFSSFHKCSANSMRPASVFLQIFCSCGSICYGKSLKGHISAKTSVIETNMYLLIYPDHAIYKVSGPNQDPLYTAKAVTIVFSYKITKSKEP